MERNARPACNRTSRSTAELDPTKTAAYTDVKWQWYGVETKPADGTAGRRTIDFTELVTPREIDGATIDRRYTPREKIRRQRSYGRR